MSFFKSSKPKAETVTQAQSVQEQAAPQQSTPTQNAGAQGVTGQQAAPAVLRTTAVPDWLLNEETVLAEFGEARVYDRKSIGNARMAKFSKGVARARAVQSASMHLGMSSSSNVVKTEANKNENYIRASKAAAAAAANITDMDVQKIVVTNRRLVLLDEDGDTLAGIPLGLEGSKFAILNEQPRRPNHQLGENVSWAREVGTEKPILHDEEITLSFTDFPVWYVDKYMLDPKIRKDKVKQRAYNMLKVGGTKIINIALSDNEKMGELLRLLRTRLEGVKEYSADKARMLADYIGMEPAQLPWK